MLEISSIQGLLNSLEGVSVRHVLFRFHNNKISKIKHSQIFLSLLSQLSRILNTLNDSLQVIASILPPINNFTQMSLPGAKSGSNSKFTELLRLSLYYLIKMNLKSYAIPTKRIFRKVDLTSHH